MQFEVYQDRGGEYRWRLTSEGRDVAASGEHFFDRSNATRAAREFKRSAATDAYHVWSTSAAWYWDATSTNGKKVATGGQRFATEYDAQRAADNVRRNAGQAQCP